MFDVHLSTIQIRLLPLFVVFRRDLYNKHTTEVRYCEALKSVWRTQRLRWPPVHLTNCVTVERDENKWSTRVRPFVRWLHLLPRWKQRQVAGQYAVWLHFLPHLCRPAELRNPVILALCHLSHWRPLGSNIWVIPHSTEEASRNCASSSCTSASALGIWCSPCEDVLEEYLVVDCIFHNFSKLLI